MSLRIMQIADPHEAPVFSWRTLTDKRLLGFMNAKLFRRDFHMERLAAAVRMILQERPDVVAYCGDSVSSANPEEFHRIEEVLRPLAESGIPILFAPGNHDRYVRAKECRSALERFAGTIAPGRDIWPYLFETEEVRFAVMDWALPTNPLMSNGLVTQESAEFLRREAERSDSRPLVCISHFPILEPFNRDIFRHGLHGRNRIRPLLESGKIALSLCGHIHIPKEFKANGRIAEIVAGSVTRANVVTEIRCENGAFSWRRRPALPK